MSTEMVPYGAHTIVMPLADPAAARAAMQAYAELKAAIVQPRHIHREIRKDKDGKEKEVEYLKKSYWRDVATFFGLSLELVSETREKDEKGQLAYSVFYRAVAPNGRTMIGDGYCSRSESGRGYWSEHNIRATAHTRAKNRAISDMVGGGEVSYEEVFGDEDQPEPQRQIPARTVDAPAEYTTPAPKPTPRPSQQRTAPSTPTASPAVQADDLSIGEFVREAAKLGMNSKQLAERIGVPQAQFHTLNRRAEIAKLEKLKQSAGVVETAEEPEEIAFVEEDHSEQAKDASPFGMDAALADGKINRLFSQARVSSIAAKEAFLDAQFGDREYTREQVVAALEVAIEASGRTPDLNTLPAKAVN